MINQNEDIMSMCYRINPTSFITKGASRSIIFDAGRSAYYFIPNAMHIILNDKHVNSISKAIEKYAQGNKDNADTILEYFEEIIKYDLLFFSNYPNYYSDMELEWDCPSYITNSILDLDNKSDYDFIDTIQQLDNLGCLNIQLRIYHSFTASKIEKLLFTINDSAIESLQFILPYISEEEIDSLVLLSKKYPRIRFIQIYNANYKKIIYANDDKSVHIVSVKNSLLGKICCGVISEFYFSVALSTFTESQHHNSCLNRKISIDVDGNIKNCPSMPQSFGNIKDTTLQEALDHPDFKKYWNVTKDQIAVCKDCEFRYICTDCRAYTENPDDMYAKPLKCGYNPYTCEWKEWSTNPLKQQAIDYYGMREVLPEFKLRPDYIPIHA